MQAVAVFHEARQVRLIDREPPGAPGPGQVRLRSVAVGICGTDREIARFEAGTPPPGSDHLVIGHECLAEVDAVGEGVEDLSPGDLVVPMVRRPCPHERCRACRNGRQDFCYTGDFIERGIKGADGFMAGQWLDEPQWLVAVPAALRRWGVLIEPLSIAEKALAQIWQVQQRLPWACEPRAGRGEGWCHRAVVLGAGPIGLLGGMALANAGFETFIYSREPQDSPRAELAGAFGATYISSSEVPIDDLAERLGEIDVVYEATGVSSLAFAAIQRLGVNGVFVLTGVPHDDGKEPVAASRVMRRLVVRNQVVFGTVNAGRSAHDDAVADLQTFARRWPEALDRLLTRHIDLEQVPAALQDPGGDIKAIITFDT